MWHDMQEHQRAEDASSQDQVWRRGNFIAAQGGSTTSDGGDPQAGDIPWQVILIGGRRRYRACGERSSYSPGSSGMLLAECEKEGIKDLTSGLQDRLCTLSKAEQTQKQKERGAESAQFSKDPYRFVKALLGEARSGTWTSSKEEVEEVLRSTHCDPHRIWAATQGLPVSHSPRTSGDQRADLEGSGGGGEDGKNSICP